LTSRLVCAGSVPVSASSLAASVSTAASICANSAFMICSRLRSRGRLIYHNTCCGRLRYPLPSLHVGIAKIKPVMSHKHENLIQSIFRDPISANIHWREVESLLNHLGAHIEELSGARLRVKLNGYEEVLHRPHHSNTLGRQDVKNLREYLGHARITPSLYDAMKARAKGE